MMATAKPSIILAGAAALAVALASAAPAAAAPAYARPSTDVTLRQARAKAGDEVVWLLPDRRSHDVDKLDCTIEVLVINPTDDVRWAILLEVQQTVDASKHEHAVHIPYLPAAHEATVLVPCAPGTLGVTGQGQVSISAGSASSVDEAVRTMARLQVDTVLADPIRPGGSAHQLLTAALAIASRDDEVPPELVEAILRTSVGTSELARAIASRPYSWLALGAGERLGRLPLDGRIRLAELLLADPTQAKTYESRLHAAIPSLCADRARAMQLWIAAQELVHVPPRLRARIRSSCAPVRADAGALAAALASRPASPGVLDALDDTLFAAVLVEWSRTRLTPELVPTYLATTPNRARFAAVAALVGPAQRLAAVDAVIRSSEPKLRAQRLAWLRQTLDAIDELAQLEPIARPLFELELRGELHDQERRGLVERLHARAPRALAAARWSIAGERDTVFDIRRLAAADVDPAAFLAYVQTGALDRCAAGRWALLSCARSIATAPVAGLPPLVRTALRPALDMQLRKWLAYPAERELANELAALGWDLGFVAEDLCARVRRSVGTARDFYLADARRYTCARQCVADIDAVAVRRVRALQILGVLGLLALLLVGAVLLVRWWRQGAVPGGAATSAAAPGAVAAATTPRDERLGAHLGRGLVAGLESARRDAALGTLGASGALDRIGPAIIERAAATVQRAVATGVAASLLVRDEATTGYVLALPVRDAPPETVRRYLGAAWPEHMREIQRVASSTVTTLIVLCGPDAAEATLLVGRSDGARGSDPEVLLGAREAAERGANSFHHVIPLAV